MTRALTRFHPDLRRVAWILPRSPVGPRRVRIMRRLGAIQARRDLAGVETATVGAIRVRVHRPRALSKPASAMLWIHGGGYVIGAPAQDDALCRTVAEQLGIVVAAVEYRLAPEHPFPTPLEDCHDALVWLAARNDVDAASVAIGGASAGGGLAAALALLARDRGQVAPVFQLLSYPMLDDRTATRTDLDQRHARLWNNKSNRFGWQSYLGKAPGSAAVDGLAAPARHDNLAGVAPAWIGVGTLDIFYDEDVAYAERLQAAGVTCDVDVVEGAFHGFDSVRPRASVTDQFRAAQLGALARAFGRAPTLEPEHQ